MNNDETLNDSYTSDGLAPSVDLSAILADFRRFIRVFIAVALLTFLAIFIPVLMQTPKYTATSSVMIDPREMKTGPDQEVLSGLPGDTTTVDTETQILQSSPLVERVTKSLNLDRDPEFNPSLASTRSFFDLGHAGPALRPAAPLETAAEHQSVLNRVRSALVVKRQGVTRIIDINFTTASPQKSQMIANEWARLYLSQQLEAKFDATKEANVWLNSKLGDLRAQVESAETALQQYKIANNLMNTSSDNTLAQSEMTSIDQQLATARADQAEADARLAVAKRQLLNGSTGEDVGEALHSDVIKNLRTQRAVVSQNLADLESKYGPLHPDIIKGKRQMQDIDGQIQAEVKRIISNLEAQALVAQQRTGSLQGSVGRVRGELVGNNIAAVKLNELQRNADAVTGLYQSYLDRFKETSAQSGLDRTDARIVANAQLPTAASSPKVRLSGLMAAACGLLLGALAVLLRRALDTGLMTSKDVESILHQPYLTSIAELASTIERGSRNVAPVDYIKAKPFSAFAEGFRSLRAALIYSQQGEEVKVIAVTSSLPGEGKTTTSLCLAQTMAMSGQKVVIVDCDLRRRSISSYFSKDVKDGLLEVLAGTANLDDVLILDAKTEVSLLPVSKSGTTSNDVFGSEAMDELLITLRERFDVVVLDTAPVLPVVDTRILARKADAVAMLVRWRRTPRKAVSSSLELLQDVGANVFGVALTQVNVRQQARYGYGDAGYYYRQYKKYYVE